MRILWTLFWGIYSSLIFAHTMPEHSRYQILITDPTTSTVTKQSFNTIPQIIFAQNFTKFVQNKQNVSINLEWETPYFSAWVKELTPSQYSINFWGGIARIPGMNDNGLALIACHEVGHLLGGEPRSKLPSFLWASAEGQSDYYATSLCLKDYFGFLFDTGKLNEPEVDRILYTRCLTQYAQTRDLLICLNIMNGIEGFKSVLFHLDAEKREISYSKKSPKAKKTNTDSYPDPQCRIETLIAGNFCGPYEYPCLKKEKARPQCWFVD